MNSYDKQNYEEMKREKEVRLAEYESGQLVGLIWKAMDILRKIKAANRKWARFLQRKCRMKTKR